MQHKNKARFQFKGYKIAKSLIEISEDKEINDELRVNFIQSQGINENEYKFRLSLEVEIFNDSKTFNCFVKCYGYFDFDKSLTPKQQEDFFNINAPAILFPYLRAYISSLTTLSGIAPITLPTINLSSGVGDKE